MSGTRAAKSTAGWRQWGLALGAGVLLVLAGCSSQDPQSAVAVGQVDSSLDSEAVKNPRSVTQSAAPSVSPQAPNGEPAPQVPQAVTNEAGDARDIIRTAQVQVEITLDAGITRDTPADIQLRQMRKVTAAAASQARAAAIGVGGYISDSVQSDGGYTVTARIPKAGYDSFLGVMSGVGDVVSASENSQDVTAQVSDTASRIKTMRASVERIRVLLAEAKDVSTIVKIEAQLTQREADLDALLTKQEKLGNQVAYSTIVVGFSAVLAPVPGAQVLAAEKSGFIAGLAQGWAALGRFCSAVATMFGAILPFLPIVVVVWLAWRLLRAKLRPTLAEVSKGHPVSSAAAQDSSAG